MLKPFQRIEHELREAHIKGLEIALKVVEEHAEKHGANAATDASADEIRRLIAGLEEQQRRTALM